jgi:hypothetical protein
MSRCTKNLTVINIDDTLRIYSKNNNIHSPIGVIKSSKLVQDFGIIRDDDNDDEYIITRSNDVTTIHSWKNNLETPIKISELVKELCKDDLFKDPPFTHIEFKDNKIHLYLYDGEKWITKKDFWKELLGLKMINWDKNKNSSNSKGVNDKNIFYDRKI